MGKANYLSCFEDPDRITAAWDHRVPLTYYLHCPLVYTRGHFDETNLSHFSFPPRSGSHQPPGGLVASCTPPAPRKLAGGVAPAFRPWYRLPASFEAFTPGSRGFSPLLPFIAHPCSWHQAGAQTLKGEAYGTHGGLPPPFPFPFTQRQRETPFLWEEVFRRAFGCSPGSSGWKKSSQNPVTPRAQSPRLFRRSSPQVSV